LVTSDTFVDNNKQQIDVIGNSTLNHDATWQDLGVPYNMRYLITIAADLKLQPGVVLKMGSGAGFFVDGQGSFNAGGTADNPIVIKGWEATPGYWGELEFEGPS